MHPSAKRQVAQQPLPFAPQIAHVRKRLSSIVQWQAYITSLLLNDLVMTALALTLATYIRLNVPLPIFNVEAMPTIPPAPVLLLGFVPLWLLLFALQGLYNRRNLLGGLQEYAGVFRAITIGTLLVVISGFLEPTIVPARGWLLVAWTLMIIFVAGGRFILRRLVYSLRRHGYFLSPTLIVGSNAEAESLAAQLHGWHTSGLYIVGFASNRLAAGTALNSNLQILGSLEDVDQIIQDYHVEELILASSALSESEMLSIFKRYGVRSDLSLRLSTGLFEIITTGLEVKELAFVPLMRMHRTRLRGLDLVLKFALDYVVGLVALLITLPLFVAIAVIIKLDSPGPLIYRRRVMGLNGREFDAYKFRTMYLNGDQLLAQRPDLKQKLDEAHKLKDDPRITRVGKWLRKYSLDVIPQLFNVFKRELSLVGPRMISPPELAMYDQWDMNLLTVHPGITGLWQVSGRSDISYSERVHLDMHYIRNWTIWLYLQILFQTIPAVLRGRGAY